MLRHFWGRRVLAHSDRVDFSTRCRANVSGAETTHDSPEQGTQGELGVLSEAPQVQYCVVVAPSRAGWCGRKSEIGDNNVSNSRQRCDQSCAKSLRLVNAHAMHRRVRRIYPMPVENPLPSGVATSLQNSSTFKEAVSFRALVQS